MGKTVDSVATTINEGVKRGIIDRKLHAAPISVMFKLAETIDDPEFPIINDRYDNVSIPTLLKYLQSLGLTMQDAPSEKKDGKKEKSKLEKARERRLNVV